MEEDSLEEYLEGSGIRKMSTLSYEIRTEEDIFVHVGVG